MDAPNIGDIIMWLAENIALWRYYAIAVLAAFTIGCISLAVGALMSTTK